MSSKAREWSASLALVMLGMVDTTMEAIMADTTMEAIMADIMVEDLTMEAIMENTTVEINQI